SLLHFATFASSTTSSVTATAEVGKAFKEAEALLNWKASLDNQNKSLLSSWVGDRPCINWVEITCDDLELGVTRLNLSSFGLKGTLYNLNFSSFPNLHSVFQFEWKSDIGKNFPRDRPNDKSSIFNGFRPHSSFYEKLEQFISSLPMTSDNELSGPIPLEIGKLGNLTILFLLNNKFSGSVPREVGMVRSLTQLDLSSNFLIGPIPSSIGNLSELQQLTFIPKISLVPFLRK
ncbi:mdis1-interacting receptor like kinase 2, partial [Quercus suber]